MVVQAALREIAPVGSASLTSAWWGLRFGECSLDISAQLLPSGAWLKFRNCAIIGRDPAEIPFQLPDLWQRCTRKGFVQTEAIRVSCNRPLKARDTLHIQFGFSRIGVHLLIYEGKR